MTSKRLCKITGRLGRTEFWIFAGFALALLWALQRNATTLVHPMVAGDMTAAVLVPVLAFAIVVIALVVFLACSVARRLNDAGIACYWAGLVFVPVVGWAILAGWLVLPSTEKDVEFAAE